MKNMNRCKECDILMKTRVCALTFFCTRLSFSTVTPFMAVASIISQRDFSNLNFLAFCVVFLKLRKICKPCDNFDEKTLILFGRSIYFSLRGW